MNSGGGDRPVVGESRPRTGRAQLGGNAEGNPAYRVFRPHFCPVCRCLFPHHDPNWQEAIENNMRLAHELRLARQR